MGRGREKGVALRNHSGKINQDQSLEKGLESNIIIIRLLSRGEENYICGLER